MELLAKTHIPFARDLVFRTLRDNLPLLVPHMPNVRVIEVKKRADEGTRADLLNEWTAATEIPAVARKFVAAEQLKWLDYATWDEGDFTCDWHIETHAMPGVVECRGHNVYHAAGAETELEIKGELVLHLEKTKVPRLLAGTVRPIIERIVITALKPNLLAVGDGVSGYLRAKQSGSAST